MIEDKFDLTYYSGSDLYSDGAVEDELLLSVRDKNNIEEELIAGSSWPHLYHLSNVRWNILDWYDFDKRASLLEIGSGCGALSGLFCQKVDHVVAIELSKKRSTINATRNEQYNNLKIMLGNFEDIKLTEKFDYVTLIGVFEYSICYINSPTPFEDMLNKAKSFLKPGGKLIIAIENKYGLKYFSGASEDHSGRLFDGIENYTALDRVRTFSKKTLTKMLSDAGFSKNEFYYPLPDYKLPDEIYSEDKLPQFGSIRKPCVSYDRDRYELFDERLAYDAICEDGMFEDMANSFLIISTADNYSDITNECASDAQNVQNTSEKCASDAQNVLNTSEKCAPDAQNVHNTQATENKKTLYAKYNRMRAPEYQIVTKIVESDGKKSVIKQSLRKEADAHVAGLFDNYGKLLKGGYPHSLCKVEVSSQSVYDCPPECANNIHAAGSNEDSVSDATDNLARCIAEFEYIEGESVEKELNKILHTGIDRRKDAFFDACDRAMALIYPDSVELSDFAITDEFRNTFAKGIDENELTAYGLKSMKASNIDGIFSNFIITENKVCCLDYEWVCDYPVPVEYLKYRTLFFYYSENRAYLNRCFSEKELLNRYGIDEKMAETFAKMESNFQEMVHGAGHRYSYMKNYTKQVTNIGKNMQNGEKWFLSIMRDLNEINHNLGPHRRDLVECRIDCRRKSEALDQFKNRVTHPRRTIKNAVLKLQGKR